MLHPIITVAAATSKRSSSVLGVLDFTSTVLSAFDFRFRVCIGLCTYPLEYVKTYFIAFLTSGGSKVSHL